MQEENPTPDLWDHFLHTGLGVIPWLFLHILVVIPLAIVVPEWLQRNYAYLIVEMAISFTFLCILTPAMWLNIQKEESKKDE